jgi:hypothetical protein
MTAISDLPISSSIDDSDVLVVNEGSTTSQITKQNLLRGRPFITVGFSDADYICDGTADNVQIQAAIDAISVAGGGTIVLRAGTYTLAASLTIANTNLVIQGEGRATLINFPGATVSPAFEMADTTQRSIVMRDMRFATTDSGSGTAINANYFVYSKFQNITIANGILIGFDFNVIGTYYNTVENCHITTGGAGYAIRFDNTANENTVMRTRIVPSDSLGTGVYVNAHSNALYEVNVETNAGIGIDVGALGHGTLISGCYLEGNVINLQLASGVEGVLILTGEIADADTSNFVDNGADSYQFIGTHYQYATLNKIGGSSSDAAQVINSGTTQQDALVLDMEAPTSGGASQRDSHALRWRGSGWDGAVGRTIDYKAWVDVTASGSQWLLQSRQDANSYVTKFSVDGSGLVTLTNRLLMGGAFQQKYAAKTSTYPIVTTDGIINCTSGTFTTTLPTAVGFSGLTFTIKNSGAGTITLATTSAQTIDGASTKSLSSQYSSIVVASDGANWMTISTLGTVT